MNTIEISPVLYEKPMYRLLLWKHDNMGFSGYGKRIVKKKTCFVKKPSLEGPSSTFS